MVVIARYGEVHLKGGNRDFFVNRLLQNARERVGDLGRISLRDARLVVDNIPEGEENAVAQIMADTFGITSASVVSVVQTNPEEILGFVGSLRIVGTFKCVVNRSDKRFAVTSMDFAAQCGGVICKNNPTAVVDVHAPKTIVHIDIRRDGTFIFDNVIPGVGGLPVGTGGRAVVMLSGGIDSPVAAYNIARRGMSVDFVHFATPPYTSDLALEKIKRLQKILGRSIGKSRLFVVPFTEISREIQKGCDSAYTITIMRRFMVRITEAIGIANGAHAIVTGENLGQVASQTIQGMTTNNFCAVKLPILRPLVAFDKAEIIDVAKRIGTYETSCEPHEDCCTVFVPATPATKPTVSRAEAEESKLDVVGLVERAVTGTSIN